MRFITFYGAQGGDLDVSASRQKLGHLQLTLDGQPIVLNIVQVDKLRQVFHGWLHEQALDPETGRRNWTEEEPEPVPYLVRF